MSNRRDSVVTGETEQGQGLKPKLRFPQFADFPLYDTRLGDVTKEGTDRNKGKFETDAIMGVSKEDGMVPMKAHVIADDISRYKVVRKDWFAYNPMRLNIGSIARWHGDADALVSPDYVVLHCPKREKEPSLLPEYFDHFRRSKQWDAFTNEAGDGGVRVRIYYADIAQIRIVLPDSAEQQKIADCLSSLDALIAAEGHRLAVLRDHKKGLMQALFPAPGQTTPRLRFPEFEGKGEWDWVTVSDIAQIHKGKGIAKADIIADGQQPCIRYGELYTTYGEVIEKVVSRTNVPIAELFMSKSNDVIIPASGETKLDIATAACVTLSDVALGGDLNVIRSSANGAFLSYFLNGPLKHEIAKVAQGDSVVHLYPAQIGLLKVALPSPKEQLKIANTLSALGDAIVSGEDWLETLKTHKKALMQQLFPAPETGA